MKRIILSPTEEDRILLGHPWVYDNEVAQVLNNGRPAQLKAGETVDVEAGEATPHKRYLGRALANPASKIIARIYSPSKEGIDVGFFKRRIREALERRVPAFHLNSESARIVFGEADFLPGLIVDRYVGWPLAAIEQGIEHPVTFEQAAKMLGPPESWLGIQFLSYGMDQRRDAILCALQETLDWFRPSLESEPLGKPTLIIEKSSSRVRELEGLPLQEGLLQGSVPDSPLVIFENALPFALNVMQGQKTGHFLDQRQNRLALSRFAKGKRVLDAFSYTGGFGIHAARIGDAAAVIMADSSGAALETARLNCTLNGLEQNAVTTIETDVFELLRAYERSKESFDLIILDPPAFAKSHSSITEALRGYKEINVRALKLLTKRGVLLSCSCSQALSEERFTRMIAEAAQDAGRRLYQLAMRGQSPDHPILLGYDESRYLKCGIYQVL
ncbi:class I SAM-dependent rRNA methyltransferase [Breznakiellaceae bacterium SP9]